MNERSPELRRQVLQPAMHQKLLPRAAELVEIGVDARNSHQGRRRSVSGPGHFATGHRAVRHGAVERALSELVNLNVYALLGLEVDGYDAAPCRAVQKTHDELRNATQGIGTARRDRMNQKSMRS